MHRTHAPKRKRARVLLNAAVVFLASAVGVACGLFFCNQASASVTGLPNEEVAVLGNLLAGCDCSACALPCVWEGPLGLDASGHGTAFPLFGEAEYSFIGTANGDQAFVTTPCSGSASVTLDPPANPDPQGQITISGPGVTCTTICEPNCFTFCNSTLVSVTLDGYAASTMAGRGSTASSVAAALAAAINNNTYLGPLFGAAASGATVYVVAKQVAIEYPWQTSCSYSYPNLFHGCAFSASLSPAQAIVPR
jgi:hypothetical protein